MRYEIRESAVLPPRAATFLAIAGLHVAFAYLFISGLAQSAFKEITERIQVVPVPEPEEPVEPTREYVEREWVEPVVTIPMPDNVPEQQPEAVETMTAELVRDLRPVAEPTVTLVPPDPIVVMGAHRLPNTADYYPPSEIRAGIEGAADVQVCVDANGRMRGTPTILRSSGNARLDRGAVNVARDGRYARSTQGGRPVPNCHSFRIIFDVNDR